MQLVTALLLSVLLAVNVTGQNTATIDINGNIKWPTLPAGKPYLTEGSRAISGGLDAFYDLSRSFIASSLPETLPIDTIKGIAEGTLSIGNEWQTLLTSFLGVATCLVIGLLFIVIFPLVGCCFCCCRCCGNCGGKMVQKERPNTNCRKKVFMAILFALVAFQGAGVMCAYVTNNHISETLDATPEMANNAVSDLMTFIDNVDQQFQQITVDNVNFVKATLKKDTDATRISSLITKPLVRDLNKDFKLDGVLNAIKKDVNAAKNIVDNMEASLQDIKSQAGSVPLVVTQLSDVESSITSLKSTLKVDLIDEMQDMVKKELQNGVNTAVTNMNVQKTIDDMTSKNIDKIKTDITNAVQQARSAIKDLGIEKTVSDNMDLISKIDQYRNYGGAGIASILLLVVLLQGFGLAFGVFGSNSSAKPTERGCVSNAGGNMLMASVGFLFIFGAIIMFLTTFLYLNGSLTERYVCQSLKNPTKIVKYGKAFVNMDIGNIEVAIQGKTLTFSAIEMLSSCKKGRTLYDVVHLERVFDIQDMLQKVESYKNKIIPKGFDKHLNLNNLKLAEKAGTLNQRITSLQGSSTRLTDVKTKLQTLGKLLPILPVKKLEDSVTQLQPIIDNLPINLKELTTKLKQLDTDLPTKVPKYIKSSVDAFTSHIFGIFESFVNDTMHHLHTDLGRCRPVWSVYKAALLDTVCHGIVDPLNGYWLALGWTLCFGLPSLVFSVKLAKHVRRMKYMDEFGDTTHVEHTTTICMNSSGEKPFANKVAHQDI